MRTRTLIVSGLAAGVAVLGGAGAASAGGGGGCMHGIAPTDGGGTVVEMVDLCFTPTVLHVEPGTEVTFVNRDATDHMVTGVGDTWGTYEELGTDDRVAYSFDEDGVYVYTCILHPGMAGAIVAGSGTGDAGMDAAAVSTGIVSDGTDAAPPAPPVSEDSALGTLLLVGGTIGLVAGGGMAAIAVRRRREASAERVVG